MVGVRLLKLVCDNVNGATMGGPGNKPISVRLNGRDLEYITFLATELKMNKSEVIRELIRRDQEAAQRGEITVPMTQEEIMALRRVLSRL